MRMLHFLLPLAVASFAEAQTLVSYEFTGATTLPVPATTVASGVTVSGISKGNILNVVPNANLISVGPDGGTSTAITAVTLGHYIEFTVTPATGSKLDLGALIFKVRREQAGAMGWVVRSSRDNFAADLGTEDIPTVSPTFTTAAVALPAAQFSGVAGPVTFRVYTYQAAALYFADYDDIQLIGGTDNPPSVGVFSPKRVVTTKSRLNLTGVAFDDLGVASVNVNGKAAAGTANWRAKVRLKNGNNRVRIFATDTGGAVSTTLTLRVKRITAL
jgi:hypothetical protein